MAGEARPCVSPHLFGPLQLIVQRLLGNLHLDDLLPEQLILVLRPAAFVLHALQLVVQAYGHVFGHLRAEPQNTHFCIHTSCMNCGSLKETLIFQC